ncbi:MAG: class I mannose-6-phosphate isomerase [Opitutaceae bacterium]|jgi:mannose-6-phosphate isomerase|nr:class I mannose-6-phosphate isomerase [Opitutaceae bacterium]
MQQVLRFHPLYQARVWGGRALETALGRALPAPAAPGQAPAPIGESWEIVDRPEAQSVVRGGALDGLTLRQAIERHGADIMGPAWPVGRAFPILVKWLDCRERLSLQVHPPASVAPALQGEPKTENWYIAECAPGAHLIVGLRRGVTRDQFERALADLTLETCVHRFPVSRGDSILVRSGQLHAIDGGNLILEIQQNSDTTYRVYDWGRVGLDGKPRAMHIEQSLRSIQWDDFEPAPLRGGGGGDGGTGAGAETVIADAREFRIRRVPLAAGEAFRVAAGEQARILSVAEGAVRETTAAAAATAATLRRGDNAVLPFAGAFAFEATEATVLLITENFS